MKKEVILISILLVVLVLLISGCKPDYGRAVEKEIKKAGLEAGSGACKGFPVTNPDIRTVEDCSNTYSPGGKCKALMAEDDSLCKFSKSTTSSKSIEDQKKIFEIECQAHAKRDPSICEELKNLNVWSASYESTAYISGCKASVCDYGLV